MSFIVDVDHLDNQDDVLADDMGVWKNNGVDTSYVHATLSERKVMYVEKCGSPSSSAILTKSSEYTECMPQMGPSGS